MTVSKKYNDNLVAGGAVRDGNGNRIDTTYAKIANLASVATSGSYNDLTNKPVVDQTYDGTSANAQSGIAVEQVINTVKRNIGEVVTSTIPLTDAGLHLLDGSLISGEGVYSEFVEYIASIYDNNSVDTVFETPTLTENGVMGGNSFAVSMSDGNANAWKFFNSANTNPALTNAIEYIQIYSPNPLKITSFFNVISWSTNSGIIPTYFYTASNDGINWDSISSLSENINYYSYYRMNFSWEQETTVGLSSDFQLTAMYKTPYYFCTESDWQNSVTTYGVCGKFVYDSVNNTVRLPKITGFTEGTTDVNTLGDLTEAGLPNITGSMAGLRTYSTVPSYSGALFPNTDSSKQASAASSDGTNGINIDASRSSAIYGNSTTVQPQSVKILYYIVVANKTKTDIEVDIDEIVTDLNGKADTDLSNLSATGQKVIDGQWVASPLTLATDVNASTTITQYDLSSYLPNDGYQYEVQMSFSMFTKTSSGNSISCYVGSDLIPFTTSTYADAIQIGQVRTRTSSNMTTSGNCKCPVGTGRYVDIYSPSGWTNGSYSLWLNGYRRIGTNN